MAEKQRDLQALKTRWDSEKASVAKLRKTREAIEEVKLAIEQAERAYDLNRVAELRYGELPRLERELTIEQQQLGKKQGEARLLKEEVDEDDIAAIVSRWTGIPVSRLVEGETEKLLKLEELLHQRVVGQDEAVRAVADAVLRATIRHQRPQPSPSDRFCFSVRPASEKPSWRERLPLPSLTTKPT